MDFDDFCEVLFFGGRELERADGSNEKISDKHYTNGELEDLRVKDNVPQAIYWHSTNYLRGAEHFPCSRCNGSEGFRLASHNRSNWARKHNIRL